MTTTWTDTAEFSALQHCSIDSNSVKPGLYTFAADATGTGKDDFTEVPGSAGGSIALSGGALEITSPSGSQQGLINSTMADSPHLKLASAVDGDFDVQVDLVSDSDVDAGIVFRVDDNDYVWVLRYMPSGTWWGRTGKIVGGSLTTGDSYDGLNQASCQLRLVRSGNTFTGYVRATSGEAWNSCGSVTQAFAAAGDICLGVDYRNGQATATFDNLQFNSGFQLNAEALVHDSGQLYQDADGASLAWDNSTIAFSTTGSPTVKGKYADYTAAQGYSDAADADANASWTAAWQTQAELRADADTGKRYRYFKAQVDGGGVSDTLDSLACDTYSTDTTPPAQPTVTKFTRFGEAGSVDNYPLIWNEPGDADFDHCRLRKNVDGTDYYLEKNGSNLPAWTTDDPPTDWWEFADADTAKDAVASNFVDEDVTGSAVTHYVRSVDSSLNANASAWTEFTEGEAPASDSPTDLTVVDSGNGDTWTVTTTGAAAGAAILVYDHADDSLITIIDASAQTADLTAGQEVYAKALEAGSSASSRHPAASGVSVPSLATPESPDQPVAAWTDQEDGTGVTCAVSDSEAGMRNTAYTAPYGGATWTDRGNVTGDGSIDVSIAIPGVYWGRVKSEDTSNGLASFTAPALFEVSDSSTAIHKRLVDAVAALLEGESYTAHDGTEFTINTDFPPRWDSTAAPTIFVFRDFSDPALRPASLAEFRLGVTVLAAEHLDPESGDTQAASRDDLVHDIQLLLMRNDRPVTGAWLGEEPFTESRAFDPEEARQFEFLTPVTVEYVTRETRGG